MAHIAIRDRTEHFTVLDRTVNITGRSIAHPSSIRVIMKIIFFGDIVEVTSLGAISEISSLGVITEVISLRVIRTDFSLRHITNHI